MLHTTFSQAKEAGACVESYKKMAKALGGITKYGKDKPIPLDKVVEVCGLDDALWGLRCVIEPDAERDKLARLFACDVAEKVLPIYEKEYPNDKRPRTAIEVARKYANGQATDEELAATSAAWAAWDARAATRAAWAATSAAWAAWDARAATRDAWAATRAAWDARAATRAAWAATSAAWDARDAAIKEQTELFLKYLRG